MFKKLERNVRRSLHLEPRPGGSQYEVDQIEYDEREWLKRQRLHANLGHQFGSFDCYICRKEIGANSRLCALCQPWDDLTHIVFCRAQEPHSSGQRGRSATIGVSREQFPGIGTAFGKTTRPTQSNLVPSRTNFLPLAYYSSNRRCMVCTVISRDLEHTLAMNPNARVAILRPFPVLRPHKRLPTSERDSFSPNAYLDMSGSEVWLPVPPAMRRETKLRPMSERCVLPICVQGPSSSTDASTYNRFDVELNLEYEHSGYSLTSVSKWDRSLIDLNHIQIWLATCQQQHGDTCNSHLYSMSLPSGFRVIDTEAWCVVEARHPTEYVTLSYVWSQASPSASAVIFQLEQGNIQRLERKDALKDVELPEVIKDAIQFCSDLGHRYLWVDRLCVVQDGKQEKMTQLKAMDVIYHLATFTIVHLGDGKRPGLPGVSSRPRNYALSNKPWSFYGDDARAHAYLPDIAEVAEGSIWNTRGWTYQERILSRRHIFVSSDEVYLNCASEAYPGQLPHEGRLRQPESFEQGLSNELSLEDYKAMVVAYTKRELGVPSDILDAFAGVTNVLSNKLETKFLQGLPEKYLCKMLMWVQYTSVPLKPRDMSKDSSKAVISFPTWSWAAWDGGVFYHVGRTTAEESSSNSSLDEFSLRSDSVSEISMNQEGNEFYGNLVWMHYADPEEGLRPVNEERVWFSKENKLTDLNAEYRSVSYKENLEAWGRVRKLRTPSLTDHPAVRGAPGYGRRSGRPWGTHAPDPADIWNLAYPIELWRQQAVEMWRSFIHSPLEAERRREIPDDVRGLAESTPGSLVFNTTCAVLALKEEPTNPPSDEIYYLLVDYLGKMAGITMRMERKSAMRLIPPSDKYHVIVVGAKMSNFLHPVLRPTIELQGPQWDPGFLWDLDVMIVKRRGRISTRLAGGSVNLKAWSQCQPQWETVILA